MADSLVSAFSSLKIYQGCNKVVAAHRDDIHSIVKRDSELVTGSKDGHVKIWTTSGDIVSDMYRTDTGHTYCKWVTALASSSNEAKLWYIGTRDGLVQSSYGDSYELRLQDGPHRCKSRNTDRINCITQHHRADDLLFVGQPTHVTCLSYCSTEEGFSKRWDVKVSENDWVYTIDMLGEDRVLLTIGSELSVLNVARPAKPQTILRLQRTNKQRPFISSVTSIGTTTFACTVFDSTVISVDIQTGRIRWTGVGHVGRVWKSMYLPSKKLLCTCADDSSLKFWDMRNRTAIKTVYVGNGRVSCITSIDDNTFVTGNCPDQPDYSRLNAELRFWDVRVLL